MCLCSKCIALPASNKLVKATFFQGYNRWPGYNETLAIQTEQSGRCASSSYFSMVLEFIKKYNEKK